MKDTNMKFQILIMTWCSCKIRGIILKTFFSYAPFCQRKLPKFWQYILYTVNLITVKSCLTKSGHNRETVLYMPCSFSVEKSDKDITKVTSSDELVWILSTWRCLPGTYKWDKCWSLIPRYRRSVWNPSSTLVQSTCKDWLCSNCKSGFCKTYVWKGMYSLN